MSPLLFAFSFHHPVYGVHAFSLISSNIVSYTIFFANLHNCRLLDTMQFVLIIISIVLSEVIKHTKCLPICYLHYYKPMFVHTYIWSDSNTSTNIAQCTHTSVCTTWDSSSIILYYFPYFYTFWSKCFGVSVCVRVRIRVMQVHLLPFVSILAKPMTFWVLSTEQRF